MIGGALVGGVVLAALIVWSSAGGADGAVAGFRVLRLIGGVGLGLLAVQAFMAGAPAASLVAAPVALALLLAPSVGRRRALRITDDLPRSLPAATTDPERRAA